MKLNQNNFGMTLPLEQTQREIERKMVTIPFCLDKDCSGLYEDIFSTVLIECNDRKHKKNAEAIEGSKPCGHLQQIGTSLNTARDNDSA